MRLQRLVPALLAAATVALYWPAGSHPFVQLDDPDYIVANPAVAGGLTPGGLRWALTAGHGGNWHPLTWVSHMLDVELFGLDPGAHHLVGVALHAASAALLCHALRLLTGAIWPSALVAALFAWHPLHVESVAWAAERKDVLSTLCWVLALAAHARYARRPAPGRYALVLAACACGLAAKPMLVTLPFALLLLDWWPLGRLAGPARAAAGGRPAPAPRWLPWAEKLPLLALAAAASAATLHAQRAGGALLELAHVPLGRRLANALVSWAAYLGDALWPAGLAVFYPRPPGGWEPWRIALAAALLAAITVVALARARRAPALLAGWLWYLGTLVPVIGIVLAGDQSRADRYTYVPLVGAFAALAWGLRGLAPRRAAPVAAAAAAALLLLAAAARVQLGHWRSGVALFEHAAAVVPGNWFALQALGFELAKAGRQREADAATTAAYALNPQLRADAHVGAARFHVRAGRGREALAELRAAVRVAPNHRQAGPLLRELLRGSPELRPDLVAADLGAEPVGSATYHYLLGNELGRLGLFEESVAAFREAIRLQPGLAPAHNGLGSSLGNLGRYPEAAAAFREALRLDPGLAEARGNLDAVTAAGR